MAAAGPHLSHSQEDTIMASSEGARALASGKLQHTKVLLRHIAQVGASEHAPIATPPATKESSESLPPEKFEDAVTGGLGMMLGARPEIAKQQWEQALFNGALDLLPSLFSNCSVTLIKQVCVSVP